MWKNNSSNFKMTIFYLKIILIGLSDLVLKSVFVVKALVY